MANDYIYVPRKRLRQLYNLAASQAADRELWFSPDTKPEKRLQAALHKMHSAIGKIEYEEAAFNTTKESTED